MKEIANKIEDIAKKINKLITEHNKLIGRCSYNNFQPLKCIRT